MLKIKDMSECLERKVIQNDDPNLIDKLLVKVRGFADEINIPIEIEKTQVKEGLINSKIYDCITITNQEFKNKYFKFAIIYMKEYKTINFASYGESKNLKKLERRSRAKSNAKAGAGSLFENGNSSIQDGLAINNLVSGAVGSIMSIGGSKKKQEAENEYYDKIITLFECVI